MGDRVIVSQQDGIAEIRLNRAAKLNALDAAMFRALVDTGEALARDRTLRVAILRGEGRAFCAGLDFASMMAPSDPAQPPFSPFARDDTSPANLVQRAAYVWKQLPVPVIAALHGVAYGGGLQIALAADLRFAAPELRMSVMEMRWGLIPDMSGSQTLRDLVRLDVAKELTYTGRVVEADEAARLGLVTAVCEDPLARARETAQHIVRQSPSAIRRAKRLFEESWHGPASDGLRLEESLQRELLGTPHQLEAVQANLQKRAPRFED